MKEIERKFIVKYLPENLEQYSKKNIVQSYLNTESEPILRVRKYGDEYLITYKYTTKSETTKDYNICDEVELRISKECFLNLSEKCENVIEKDRYYIPYDNKIIELDIFKKDLKGLIIAEIEFSNEEDVHNFTLPNFLGNDVSKVKEFRNSYLSKNKINIEEIIKKYT